MVKNIYSKYKFFVVKVTLSAFLALFLIECSAAQKVCLTSVIEKSDTYRYLFYKPVEYNENSDKKWPLIIYLHGKSACGDNLDKVRRYGLPFFLDKGMVVEALVAAPQCPEGKNWIADDWFLPFLRDIKEKYHVDDNHIYLTGMSLGGFGTFSLAIKYPYIFAAVAPLCGGGQPSTVCPMKDIPTWVFHGDQDEQVPLKRSEEMVDALKKCGGNPKFTILKGQPHDIHKTYNNPELYKWMLKQKRNGNVNDKQEVVQNMTHENKISPKEEKVIGQKKDKKSKKKKNANVEESEKIKVEFN